MSELKRSECAGGMAGITLGLGLHFYTAGELLASLMLSSFVVLFLGLLLLTVLFVRHAGKWVVVRARVVSWNSTAPPCRPAALAGPRAT